LSITGEFEPSVSYKSNVILWAQLNFKFLRTNPLRNLKTKNNYSSKFKFALF
jgi:hypothetical protein